MSKRKIKKYRVYSIFKIIIFFLILMSNFNLAYATDKLILVTGNPTTIYQGRLLNLIYSEVFKRLELEWEYRVLPGKRRNLLLENGEVDGELSRVESYGQDHPNLLRVEESPFSIIHSAFSYNPEIQLSNIYDLKETDYKIYYKRGAHKPAEIIEHLIKIDLVKPKNVGELNEYVNGLRMLQHKRIDLFIANSFAIKDLLLTDEFINQSIHEVLRFSESPIYAYMNIRHEDIAVQMAIVLKQMRYEGLIDQYMREAEIDKN